MGQRTFSEEDGQEAGNRHHAVDEHHAGDGHDAAAHAGGDTGTAGGTGPAAGAGSAGTAGPPSTTGPTAGARQLTAAPPVDGDISSRRAVAALGVALLLGLLADGLLREVGPIGLGFSLWVAAAVVALLVYVRRWSLGLSGEAVVLLAAGVAFAGCISWRDSEALKVLDIGVAALLLALPALRAGATWVRRGGVGDHVKALVQAGASGAVGALLLLGEVDWRGDEGRVGAGAGSVRSGGRYAVAALRGVLIALPLLLIFGGLFMAADAVFAHMVQRVVRIRFDVVWSHILLTGFFAWAAAGYASAYIRPLRLPAGVFPTGARPRLGIVEMVVVLGLVDLLFLAFLLVQLRYLFGGAGMVEVTPGLTYAEYARRGFFELVAVTVLVLPLLLMADHVFWRDRPGEERLFRLLAGAQVLLLLAVVGSALYRLRLYQEAYGLTESRFYATALILWLAAVVLWLAATVLRGRRERFAFGALLAGLVTLAALHAVNPEAWIARTNLERAAAGHPLDGRYVASLGLDAAPELIRGYDLLASADRCRVAAQLLERWGPAADADWRAWSWGGWRARRVIADNEARLRAAVPASGQCS